MTAPIPEPAGGEVRRPAGHGAGSMGGPCPQRATLQPQVPRLKARPVRAPLCILCSMITSRVDGDGMAW